MGKPTEQVRDLTMRRDRYRCVRCGKPLDSTMASLHHRRLRSHPFEGLHNPSNLIWLCGSGTTGCHGWVHAHPAEAETDGYIVHAWDDPKTVPVTYHGLGPCTLNDDGSLTRTVTYHELGPDTPYDPDYIDMLLDRW